MNTFPDYLFLDTSGNALNSFFKWAGDGISSFWSWISGQNVKSAKNPPSKLARIIASTINKYSRIAKADARIRARVRRKSQTRYWSANLRDGYVDIGRPLSFSQAKRRVKNRQSVFTVTKKEARALALSISSNKKIIGPEKHGSRIGYYKHFHVNRKNHAHIWYLF